MRPVDGTEQRRHDGTDGRRGAGGQDAISNGGLVKHAAIRQSQWARESASSDTLRASGRQPEDCARGEESSGVFISRADRSGSSRPYNP